MPRIQRTLISVSDKTGIVELAQTLSTQNIHILSTGGTARLLTEQNIPVTEVSTHTGFPEIMDGRVKTLHPKIHGGLLGRRDDAELMKRSCRNMAFNRLIYLSLIYIRLKKRFNNRNAI